MLTLIKSIEGSLVKASKDLGFRIDDFTPYDQQAKIAASQYRTLLSKWFFGNGDPVVPYDATLFYTG